MSNEKGSITIGQLIGGCVGAVIVVMIVGFTWGGWVTESSAQTMQDKSTKEAVAERLGKICVAQAQQSEDLATQLEEIKKVASYNRLQAVMKKSWTIMPGEEKADSDVARACMDELLKA